MHVRDVNTEVTDGTGSGFLACDTTRPNPVVERCETNPRQRLDSCISYLSGNPNRLVAFTASVDCQNLCF